MVELDAHRDVPDRLQCHVEPEARPEGAGGGEDVSPPQLVAPDSRQRDGHALPRLRPRDRPVVHLDAADPHHPSARLDAQLVSLADRPRPERARRDRADAVEREGAVDVEPRRAVRRRPPHSGSGLGECRPELLEAGAGARTRRDHRCPRHELLGLQPRELERLGVDEVGLRQGDDAALDPEQAQDREMLVRLRPRAFPGVDHEQEEVDAARARDHRPHEALVAGDVDDREAGAVGQLERRVAELDRDAALVLGGEPVRVLPGQRLDERRLPVVDVAGGADGQRHRTDAREVATPDSCPVAFRDA